MTNKRRKKFLSIIMALTIMLSFLPIVNVSAIAPTSVTSASLSDDTGYSSTDFITKTAGQTISGSLSTNLATGEFVEVSYDNGVTWDNATSFTEGSSSWSTMATLSGSGTFQARVTDAEGSSSIPYSHTYTLDTTAPTAISISSTNSIAGSGSVTLTAVNGPLSNASWTSILNQIKANTGAGANWITGIVPGDLTMTPAGDGITATLNNGNAGAATITIDFVITAENIVDRAGNVAAGNVTIDSYLQGVTVTGVSSSTANGAYKAGDTIAITVSFSGNVDVTGTPVLNLETGTTDRNATYVNGSGSNTLTFNYVVQAGDTAADLDYKGTDSLALSGGTIKNAGTAIAASVTLPVPGEAGSLGSAKAIIIDTTAPTAISISSTNSIAGSGSVTLTAVNGPLADASWTSILNQIKANTGAGANWITGILAGDLTMTPAGDGITATLNNGNAGAATIAADFVITAGNIVDRAGNVAAGNVTIDSYLQGVTVTGVSSSTENGTYKAGDTIAITVSFSGNVDVTGTPVLNLETGTTDRDATYANGSGSNTLTFNYVVQAGDTALYLDYKGTDSLTLSGGTIKNAGTAIAASLTLPAPGEAGSLGNAKEIIVDALAPTIDSVSVPVNGTYKVGQNLDYTVNLNETVVVGTAGGTPYLKLTIGNSTVHAAYVSGNNTSTLLFRYTVASGNLDTDGVALSNNITLNGGTIKDTVGNNAAVTFTGSTTAGVLVDAAAPTINSGTMAISNGYIDIIFDEGVYGANDGITALTASKLMLTFTQNGGTATNAVISSVKQNDNIAENSASALEGGEMTVRVFLTITGTPNGLETIEVRPANATSIYDRMGNAMQAVQTSGIKKMTDKVEPTPGSAGTITAGSITATTVDLSWAGGADAATIAANLQYKLLYSIANNIANKTDAEANGTVSTDWTPNITSATVSGLTQGTTYYFNVLVKDAAGNIACYTSMSAITTQQSSSSGGSTNTPTAVVEINGQKQDAGTADTQTNGGQTVTTIKVDETKLNKLLDSGGDMPTVTLLANKASDVVAGELNGQTVKNMEEKEAVLEIKTDTVSYTLPASQINIDAVSSQIGAQVELKDIKVSVKISEPSADTVKIVEDTAKKDSFQIVVKPVEFEIRCTSGDKSVLVSKFNGYVERTISIPDGVDPSKISTGIVLNSDGSFRHVPTTIIKNNGKYYAKINSLTNSTYSVIWNPVTFVDAANHWAKDAVNDMGSRMIVTGVEKGTYEPNRSITRAEFAAIVVRALGLAQGTNESSFGDVSQSEWFNGYVDTATTYGLLTGYSEVTFGPKDIITREQAMVILARAMKTTGLNVKLTDTEISTLLANYEDGSELSNYAKVGVATCVKSGIVTGSSTTTLSPKAYVTRAEVALMVQHLLQKSELI